MPKVFGPIISFYDDSEAPDEFQIIKEEDGLFFEIRCNDEQKAGVTIVLPDLIKLDKVIKKAIKRLSHHDVR